ncbi:MAG: hypothetical protein DRJ03_11710 [Chloroflexi bacterium]|nr:MAG: hypothetical protein DRJ03_11710 [Chloroflexota bacterium]
MKLKKAGMPIWVTVMVALISTPGFLGFIDNTDKDAEAKAEAAYEVLKAEVEFLRRDDARLTAEIRGLRQSIFALSRPSVPDPTWIIDVPSSSDPAGAGGDVAPGAIRSPASAPPAYRPVSAKRSNPLEGLFDLEDIGDLEIDAAPEDDPLGEYLERPLVEQREDLPALGELLSD